MLEDIHQSRSLCRSISCSLNLCGDHAMLDEFTMYISPKVIIPYKFINGSPSTSVYVGNKGTSQKLVPQPNGEPLPAWYISSS